MRTSFGRRIAARNAAAVAAVPLILLAGAYGLWWLVDRFGPAGLEGAFTLVVVMPVWLGAPVISGAVWTRWSDREALRGALLAGAIISLVATVLVWRYVALPEDCTYGPRPGAERFVLPAIVVGIVLGGLIALAALISRTRFAGRGPIDAVVVGAGSSVIASVVAIVVAVFIVGGAHCSEPIPA